MMLPSKREEWHTFSIIQPNDHKIQTLVHSAAKQRQLTMRNYLTVAIAACALCLTCGCDTGFERSLVSDQTWDVGDCKVREKIVCTDAIPDRSFERTYWLMRDGAELLVGSYENESSTGVIKQPYAVDDCIIIPTSASCRALRNVAQWAVRL